MIDNLPKRQKLPRKTTLQSETRSTVRLLITTLTSMIVVLIIVFLATTNQSSQKGYTLEQVKRKNEALRTDNSQITTQITDVTASSKLEKSDKLKNMSGDYSKLYVTEEDNRVR